MLKLAALRTLTKKQYLAFFFDGIYTGSISGNIKSRFWKNRFIRSKVFDETLFYKIYPYLEDDAKLFWDYLFNFFDSYELITSGLFIKNIGYSLLYSKDVMCLKNPYLNDNNYSLLRSKLDSVSIRYHQGDVFKL